MPELPEIAVKSLQMRGEMVGEEIVEVRVLQPKNLNVPVGEFVEKSSVAESSPSGLWGSGCFWS